ncbi:MAG: hypothetical protein H7039_18835 [Bryobacteraceae bacterium]|nr:hypothetical protein [Bryobacteraceae bacterium]
MNLQFLVARRTDELETRTRSEILTSIVGAALLVAVLTSKFAPIENRLLQAGVALVVAWILLTLYRFRDRLLRRAPTASDSLAASGIAHYRKELEQRRDHLRNAWVWLGPAFLACFLLLLTLAGKSFSSVGHPGRILPFGILLVAWVVIGVLQRQRQARLIQKEIDEINGL